MTVLIPVIISGGAGTRLWPVSREGHPKPFMKLADGETLLEKTYRRAANLPGVIQVDGVPKLITVTNRDYYFLSRDELQKAGVRGSFLLEPCGRNTAPAIAMAAHYVQDKFGSDALMLVLSADHLIRDELAFSESVQKAVELASLEANYLVTFGIVPTIPETGFGYIKTGARLMGGYYAEAFVEKPDAATAQKYLDAGGYFWNSGMFCFSAQLFLKQLGMYAPEVGATSAKCWLKLKDAFPDGSSMLELPEELFQEIPDISVDYAVMEHSSRVAVVPSDIGWSDVGSWNAIRELLTPDMHNNAAFGDAVFLNSKNTFVQSEDRLVAAVGLDDIMIIDTPDALLVAKSDSAQEVKNVTNILKEMGSDVWKQHKTVCRPWGTYTVLAEAPGFKVKRIEVKPGSSLSLQKHQCRSEHWVVVQGEAVVTNGNEEIVLCENESTYIPAGHKHRLQNTTENDLVLVEIQCGDYLGEDDIVRFEDVYGRK